MPMDLAPSSGGSEIMILSTQRGHDIVTMGVARRIIDWFSTLVHPYHASGETDMLWYVVEICTIY